MSWVRVPSPTLKPDDASRCIEGTKPPGDRGLRRSWGAHSPDSFVALKCHGLSWEGRSLCNQCATTTWQVFYSPFRARGFQRERPCFRSVGQELRQLLYRPRQVVQPAVRV